MTKEQLFESLNLIDNDILERSEKTHAAHKAGRNILKFCAVAACFGLIITSAFAIDRIVNDTSTSPIPTKNNPLAPAQNNIRIPTIPYNTAATQPFDVCYTYYADVSSIISADRLSIPGYFTEELNETELIEVLPDGFVNTEDYSGYASFDHTGTLIAVHINVKTRLPKSDILVTISTSDSTDCYVLNGSPIKSFCGTVEFYRYIYRTDTDITFFADTHRDGVYYHFEMHTTPDNFDFDAAHQEFTSVLTRFTNNGKDVKVPDFSLITPDVIPEYRNDILTLSEAISDPDFGAYMLANVPAGYQNESIRRYTDQNQNYLSGLWTHGYDSLSWRVYYLGGNDSARITNAADTINYDLSLYPIPRAESVPEELREIVDNPIFLCDELTLDVIYKRAYTIDDSGDSEGYRMRFSVLYGDIIVEISTKGISPEWLYEQLSGLIK